MSFPNMMGSQGDAWSGYPPHGQPAPPQPLHEPEDHGLQVRPMGLKVQYTFEKDQQNCLARWPHILQIQTVPIDERNAIGVIDLKICLQAIAQCSPEIVNQQEKDYAVYALDYSEDDMPLVGQGMLSWGLEQPSPNSEQKLITGRVTKNMLALFGNGIKETLEVKLKLNAVPKMQRPQTSHNSEMQRGYGSNAPTPTPTDSNAEWVSLIQSNPNFGRSANGPSMPSPSPAPARYGSPLQIPSPAPDARPDTYAPSHAAPTPPPLNASLPHPMAQNPFGPPPSSQGPAPYDPHALLKHDEPAPSARPAQPKRSSSKAPRKKKATGNPIGRPRKHPRQDSGNNSALEDATDADEAVNEAPKKKRAKTTKADWTSKASLDAAPGSLRVAASTSGSLRTMRPAASGGNGTGGGHLQEMPRAPTPIPGQPPRSRGRTLAPAQPRRPSVVEFEGSSKSHGLDGGIPGPQSQDARSPLELAAQSPSQAYTPEESPADIGSSPPVPRSAQSVRSSPPPSSPVLPPMPMPMPQPDSGFMSGGFDEMADECELPRAISMPPRSEAPKIAGARQPVVPGRPKLVPKAAPPRPMVIEQICPGPPELLPKKSIYAPTGSRALNSSRGTGTKAATRQLKRANTEPNLQRQEMPGEPTGPPPMPQPPPEPGHFQPGLPQSEPVNELEVRQPEPANESQDEPVNESEAPALAVHEPEVRQSEPANESQDEPVKSEAPALAVHEPEVRQSEPANESRDEPVNESEAPALAVHEPFEDSEDPLLRLLGESLDTALGVASELPPITVSEDHGLPLLSTIEMADPAFIPPVTASDTGALLPAMMPPFAYSEGPDPPSKNISRKQSIREKLEQAVEKGIMPTFCSNCGAISTPTWRKIWTHDFEGSPEFPVFSDKPGCITAIIILERDEKEKPIRYQVVKKALGPAEDKSRWKEDYLCNPCGIWLSKCKSHRPEDRWEKDAGQMGKSRKPQKKVTRSKRGKGQSRGPVNLTSEAYFTTDPIGPGDQGSSPPRDTDEVMLLRGPTIGPPSRERCSQSQDLPDRQGSTHSRGSGTAQSPIALEEDGMGKTRRLLFPSPRKDGQPKVLGEVAMNIVKMAPRIEDSIKIPAARKENMDANVDVEMSLLAKPKLGANGRHEDEMADLFGTPPRPSTPPPKDKNAGPFKTPTRPTPSHRPITRSISKSIRSAVSIAKSPGHALLQLQQTPTKTPRSASVRRRIDSNNHQHLHAHFVNDDDILGGMMTEFGSPFPSTLNQLLSEANDFTTGSSAHGLGDLDITSLPNLDSDAGLSGHLESLDFGHFLTTDAIMPSSPPVMNKNGRGGNGAHVSFSTASTTFDGSGINMWESFGEVAMADATEGDERMIEKLK